MSTLELNRTEFENLLTWLSPNKKEAGQRYENIRQKLLKFFEWRGCFDAEECTDQTIDRVMSKISQGEEIRTKNQYLYFLGVARNVLLEYWKKQQKRCQSLDEVPPSQMPSIDPEEIENQQFSEDMWQKRLGCMKRCLKTLPEQKRVMITGYYQGERRTKIENRQKLAQWLQLSENALRIRTYRIRDELETCINGCVKKKLEK
jgi:DNA-directed RNA polymerase specialized sigma24 family protein